MNNRFVRRLAGAVLCVFLAGGIAQAASFTYSEQRKQIKAGVVVLGNAPLPSVTFVNPYVFHIMNQRQDLKPSGWDFYNPLAPTHVTEGIVNRWGAPYTEGQAVHKDMGCYWEVLPASATPDNIAQFDVLLIPGSGVLEFTPAEREKLRKFVDNGGVLWIDNYGGAQLSDGTNHFFIINLQFGGSVNGPVSVSDFKAHSLLNRPFLLAWTDINKLGGRLRPEDPARTLSGGAGGGKPDERYFISILVAEEDKPVASVAHYGSGHIVVVAEGISAAIADPVGVKKDPLGNDIIGFCSDRFVLAESEDLKFAYNIVSLGSQYATFQKAPRRPGYSFAEIGAPLSTLWEYRAPDDERGPTTSSPAILDDMLFYVDGAGMLHAFEMVPSKDRNGDGEPDDGENDPEGAPYDELWSMPLGGPASSPTAAYVPIDGDMTPVVFVALGSGQVVAVNAVTGNVIGDVFSRGTTPFPEGMDVPAPAYVDGTVYLGDGAGRLHAKNYFASREWANPETVTSQCPAHSPTAGYYCDPTTGATELVVYLAKRGDGLAAVGEMYCYSVAAFNERLTAGSQAGLMRTRSADRVGILDDVNTWDLYYYIDDPVNPGSRLLQPVPDGEVTLNPPNQPGFFQINKDYFENVINGAPVIADYYLDYSSTNAQPRRRLNVLHPSTPDWTGIACAPATSRKDILYFAAENGSLYAVKDRGYSGDFICKWRWHLKDEGAKSALGLSEPVPVGSPAVAGDMVYFAVNDGGQGMILAFKADPAFSVHLPKQAEPGSVKVQQYDTMNPSTDPLSFGGGAAQDDFRPNATYIVDYDSGKVTILNFCDGGHYLSAAQDLILEYKPVGSDTVETALIEAFNPAPGDKWNNLVWFTKPEGPGGAPLKITSSPVVMGDILYVGCSGGILVSMDVVKIGRGKTGPAEAVDWAEAVDQGKAWAEPVMGSSGPILASVAGSHGMLAVATAEGVTVLHNPVTLIADGDRLVEMDAGGRVAWSCDSTVELAYTTTGAGAAAMPVLGLVKVPFNRPAVARRAPAGGIVVADTGNNRVVYIDGGGNVLWQITTFEDPEPNQLLPAGSPLSLNRPKDVSMWVVNEPVDPSDANAPKFPAYHYLIADSGNYRVLEVVARRDPNTGLYRNELDWTTKTLAEGKKYEYASARIVRYYYDPDAERICYDLVCVVANEVSDAQGVCPGGALIEITGIGTPNEAYTVCRGDDPGLAVNPQRPVFFTRYYTSSTLYTDVALEADAIHVVVYTVDSATGTATPNVRPVFTARGPGSYEELTRPSPNPNNLPGLPLAAAYAQVLPNGNVLVTNKATVGSGPFKGEIFELRFDGTQWWIVDNSQIGVETPNSHGLRQPSSAERQLNR